MAIAHPVGTSNAATNAQTFSIPLPTSIPAGARVYAWACYTGDFVPTPAAGWVEEKSGALTSAGRYSLISRTYASGMAAPSWTLAASTTGTYGKWSGVARYVTEESTRVYGPVVLRTASGTSSTASAVSVPANGLLQVFYAERWGTVTAGTIETLTAPSGMANVTTAKNTDGSGGSAVLVADQVFTTAASSGTKITSGTIATANAVTFLLASAPLAASAPTFNAGADRTDIEPFTTVDLVGTVTGTATAVNWDQTSGPTVQIINPDQTTAQYVAPGALTDVVRVFRLSGVNGTTAGTPDTVSHTVLAATERAVVGGVEVPMNTRRVSTT